MSLLVSLVLGAPASEHDLRRSRGDSNCNLNYPYNIDFKFSGKKTVHLAVPPCQARGKGCPLRESSSLAPPHPPTRLPTLMTAYPAAFQSLGTWNHLGHGMWLPFLKLQTFILGYTCFQTRTHLFTHIHILCTYTV